MQQRGISTDILKSVKINKSAYGEEFHEAFGVTWAAIIISVVSTFYKFTPIYLSAIDKRIFLAAAFLFSPFIFLILFTHDCHPLLLHLLLLGIASIWLKQHCCYDSAIAIFSTRIALGSCEFTFTGSPPCLSLRLWFCGCATVWRSASSFNVGALVVCKFLLFPTKHIQFPLDTASRAKGGVLCGKVLISKQFANVMLTRLLRLFARFEMYVQICVNVFMNL